MTSKDYVVIAAVIANTPRVEQTSRDVLAASFAKAFALDNPYFDRAKFIQACGAKEIA